MFAGEGVKFKRIHVGYAEDPPLFLYRKKLEWDGSLVLDHVLDKRKMRVITYEVCACAVNENVKKTLCVGLCIIIA